MSAIEKIAVYDPRIVQDAPAYAVQKGALAVTVSPFQAVSATTSQHTYQVLVPSLNVFVDRKVMWQSTVYVQMDAYWAGDVVLNSNQQTIGYTMSNLTAATPGSAGPPAVPASWQTGCTYQQVRPGRDFALPMFPLQSLCTNMTASINDCVVTTNGDTLREQILLTETQRNQQQRTTPSKYDKYAWSIDDLNALNGNFSAYESAFMGQIPNGSWPITFVDQSGEEITGTGFQSVGYTNVTPGVSYQPQVPYTDPTAGTAWTQYLNGMPVWCGGMDAKLPMRICFKFTVTEPLVMSPFIWNDAHEFSEVGLYGCTNMAFTMNLQSTPSSNALTPGAPTVYPGQVAGSTNILTPYWFDNIQTPYNPIGNLIRASGFSTLFSGVTLGRPSSGATNTGNNAFANPQLLVSFLTPGVDVDLPLCSSVPYHEFPRYYTQQASVDSSGIVQTQTITLSSIPDMIMVFVKPQVRGQTQNETYVPIKRVGVTFDNFSNLCSNFSQENLYNSSVAAGLEMDWAQWRGHATAPTQSTPPLAKVAVGPFGAGNSGGTYFPIVAKQPTASAPYTFQFGKGGGKSVQLTGGPLLLRMGTDISLSPGLAPGCLGNYSIQLALTLDLASGYFASSANSTNGSGVTITLMAISSGFFETVRGQSAIRKTILNNTDVEEARASKGTTSAHLARFVGGSKGKLSSGSFMNFAAKLHKDKGGAMIGTSSSSSGLGGMGGSMGGAKKRPHY